MTEGKHGKMIFFLLSCTIMFLPFLVLKQFPDPYEYSKFIALILITQVALWFFVWKNFFTKNSRFSLRQLPLWLPICVYIATTFIADLIGLDPKVSLLGHPFRHVGFLTLLSGGIIYLVCQSENKQKYYRFFIISLFLSAFGLTLITIVQGILVYIFHLPLITYQGRIIGTLGNPDFLGGYIICLLPLILFAKNAFLARFSRQVLAIKILLTSMIIVSVLLTGSRSALLACAVIFIIGIFHLRNRLQRIIFICLLIVCCFLGTWYSKTYIKRLSLWDNRSILWSVGLKAAIARPILGYGQENYDLLFPPERHLTVTSVHNIFLEVFLSSGIIGLAAFLWLLIRTFIIAPFDKKLFLISYLIIASFNPISIAQIALFWLVFGMIEKNDKQNRSTSTNPRRSLES